MATLNFSSPVGHLCLYSDGQGITALEWRKGASGQSDSILDQAAQQLAAYFAGDLQVFDLPISGVRPGFAQRFSDALCAIPFGETCTYGDMAGPLGASAQAIGQACGANKVPIIVPCHRVLAANSLGGYSGAGGIETKVWLLKHEGAAGLLI